MGKVDCSKTLNFVKERNRICKHFIHDCDGCILYDYHCSLVEDVTQEDIDIVQKWSDEHPQQTMAAKFFEIFPNAKKMENGLPLYCPHYLGWGEYEKCPRGQGIDISCADCWNRPYSEVAK